MSFLCMIQVHESCSLHKKIWCLGHQIPVILCKSSLAVLLCGSSVVYLGQEPRGVGLVAAEGKGHIVSKGRDTRDLRNVEWAHSLPECHVELALLLKASRFPDSNKHKTWDRKVTWRNPKMQESGLRKPARRHEIHMQRKP